MFDNLLTTVVALATSFSLITAGFKNLQEIKGNKNNKNKRKENKD